LRNTRNTIDSVDFSAVIDAFLSGGDFFDEIILLSYADVKKLHSKIQEYRERADLLCLVCEQTILESVQKNLEETFSVRLENGVFSSSSCCFCLLPCGKDGERMVLKEIVPFLNERRQMRYDRMILRMVGAPSEKVWGGIDRAYKLSGDALIYNFTDRFSDQRLEVIYDSTTPKMLADNVLRILLEELKDHVYTLDDTPLETRVYEGLCLRRKKLSVAESFTGGGVAARMVSVPGVSKVYFEGLNTYDEKAKVLRLGVNEETLRMYGAASAEVAHEMAEGLLSRSSCDICVATTGIAGPLSESKEKPVGLCFIAAGIDGKIFVNRYEFSGDRENITKTAINYALFALYKLLQ
jgi:PncC family amidohydrolase